MKQEILSNFTISYTYSNLEPGRNEAELTEEEAIRIVVRRITSPLTYLLEWIRKQTSWSSTTPWSVEWDATNKV